ncbi:hypothetical protein ACPA2M_16510 [Ectopseudomonas chengduensis]
MSFPRYPEYKDSGVEWLGAVPKHWDVIPLKHVIRKIESGTSVNSTDVPAGEGELGVLKTSCVYSGTFEAGENKAVVPEEYDRVACPVTAGTLVVSRMNTPDLVGAAGLVQKSNDALFLPDRLWQVAFTDAEPAYVHYWTLTGGYRAQVQMACAGTSSSMQNLAQDQFRSFVFPKPTPDEQLVIAAFLDHETAKLDELMAEQEKLIALLKEKRQAVISHAVTKGLDPTAPMKDSRIEWLGEVPAHWGQPQKLLNVARKEQHSFVNGPFGSDLLSSELVTEGIPVVYIRDIKEKGYTRVSEWCVTPEKSQELKFCNVLPGDIIIAKVGNPPGLAAVYPLGEPEAIVTQDVIRLRLDPKQSRPDYIKWLLNSDYGRALIDDISVESTRTRVGLGEYKQLRFFMPSVPEQNVAADFLERETAALDLLVNEAALVIDLLKERRTALISAAVTGQIDVRGLIKDEQEQAA